MRAPIPSLALSNALLFADPTFDCLSGLGQAADRWQEAVVLATPFWLPHTGKLNKLLSINKEISPLVAASIRFDPDRELTIAAQSSSPLDDAVDEAFTIAGRLRVLSSFPAASLPALLQLMPGLTAVHFATAEQLTAATGALASLTGLQELRVTNCRGLTDLSVLVELHTLQKLSVGCCFNLEDVSGLTSLTSLRGLSLRSCPRETDVSVVDALPSLRTTRIIHCRQEIDPHNHDPWGYVHNDITTILPNAVSVKLLGTYADFLRSDDPDENMQGTLIINHMVSRDFNPPIDKVIEYGCVPILVAQLLRDEFPQLQFESASALAKIATQGTLLDTFDAIPNLVRLLNSPDEDCRGVAAEAIGKLAREGAGARDLCLDHGALAPVIAIVSNSVTDAAQNEATIRNAAWALKNLCRHKPLPAHEQVAPALPVFVELLNHEDGELVVNAAWALSNLTAGSSECIQRVVDTGYLPRLVVLLGSSSWEMITPAITAVGNTIANGSETQIGSLLQLGVLQRLCGLLGAYSSVIVLRTMESIHAIIKLGERKQKENQLETNPFLDEIVNCGGVERLEDLQCHVDTNVFNYSMLLMETYFGQEQVSWGTMEVGDEPVNDEHFSVENGVGGNQFEW